MSKTTKLLPIAPKRFLQTTTIMTERAVATFAAMATVVVLPGSAFAADLPVTAITNTNPGVTNVASHGTSVTQTTVGVLGCVSDQCYTQGGVGSRSIVHYQSFDIGTNKSVHFSQFDPSNVILNIVDGAGVSNLGQNASLTASGRLILVNGNGFNINGASINVAGGIIISTRGINNAEGAGFITNGTNVLNFDAAGAINALVKVKNSTIKAGSSLLQDKGTHIVLQGQRVEVDHSTLQFSSPAKGGDIAIGAGSKFKVEIDPVGDGLLSYEVTDPVLAANMANAIQISDQSLLDTHSTEGRNAGNIIITADVMNSVYDNIILVSAVTGQTVLQTNSGDGKAGDITIKAKATNSVINNSAVLISGTKTLTQNGLVTLNAKSSAGFGGIITVEANAFNTTYNRLVNIDTQDTLDAISLSGAAKDGKIIIRGKSNGVYDDNSIYLDNENFFDVDFIEVNTATGKRKVHVGANGSVVRPCAEVNGQGDCGQAPDSPAPDAPAPDAPAPDAPAPDAPAPDAPAPDAPAPDAPAPDAPAPDAPAPDAPAPDAPAPDAPAPDAPAPDAPAPDAPAPDAPAPDAPAPDAPAPDAPAPDAPAPDAPAPDAPAPDAPAPDAPAPDSQPDSIPDRVAPDSPPDAPAPDAPAPDAPAPDASPDYVGEIIDPLDRPVLSLRDYEVLDVNDFPYVLPYANFPGAPNYSILGGGINVPPQTGLSPAQLGGLAPAAGGNAEAQNEDEDAIKKAKKLGKLAPAAGGLAGTTNTNVQAANNFLDAGWSKPAQ